MLKSLNAPGQELAGGIRFIMMDGVDCVGCWVSLEALNEIEGGDPSQQERTARFERHRPKIEELARQKFDAGEKSPIVMTFDFRTLR
jgi:hypothetical protein